MHIATSNAGVCRVSRDCPMGPTLGTTSFVTNVRWNDVSFPERSGPLSIKLAFDGREEYRIGGRDRVVSDGTWLLINEGEEYSSAISGTSPVETFCFFFRRGLPAAAARDLERSDALLLDDPEATNDDTPRFHSHLRRPDPTLSRRLSALRRALLSENLSSLCIDEEAHRLLLRLLAIDREDAGTIDRMPAKRASTRQEQFRRVHAGRDFIEANFTRSISLEEISRAACLSSYHFLRLFRSTFGTTPGRYITERRIEEARRLLGTTDLPIVRIAEAIGFESAGSFAHLFRQRTGRTPGSLRLARSKKIGL